ncbi:O-antigen ligase family protein, partial [bacterium]|nr:O-antigen ligase family protein [candidate division CSSED10-310 bacterium]
GCALEILADFPTRRITLLLMVLVVIGFTTHRMRKGDAALGWLILTLGLTSAPLTELNLQRNLWTLAACLMGMIHTILSGRFFTEVPRRIHLAFAVWVALSLLALISGIWSVYPYMSIRHAGILLFDSMIFIQVSTILTRPERRNALISLLLTVAGVTLIAAAFALLERIIALGSADAMGFRFYVFERHPNYVIFYLLMSLPLWFLPLQRRRTAMTATVLTGLACAVAYLLLFSFSRQGYIVIMVYSLAALWMVREPLLRRLILVLTGLISGIGVASAWFRPEIRHRLMSLFDTASSLRWNAWRVFIDLIRERPFTGYGLGTNRYIYPKALGFVRPGEVATRQFLFEAHNAYIDILTGLGIIGLVLFITFLLICTLPGRRPRSLEQRTALALSLGIWIDLFFNYRLHAQDTGTFLMVFVAITAAYHATPNVRNQHTIRIPKWPRIAAVTTATVFCALPWLSERSVNQAQAMLGSRNWPQIMERFQRAAWLEPLNAHPHYYIALCHKQMQQPAEAYRSLLTAVNLCPNYSFYRFHLAMDRVENRQFEDALHQLEAARNLEPYDPDGRIRFHLGILEWRLGYHDPAINDLWSALLLNPAYIDDPYWDVNPDVREKLLGDGVVFSGSFFCKGALIEKRMPYLLKAVEFLSASQYAGEGRRALIGAAWNYPLHVNTVIAAVLDLCRSRRFDEAERLLYHALAVNPQQAMLHNYLGYVYLNQERYPMVQYCVHRASQAWSEIALDNYFGYQLLAEAAVRTGNRRLLARMEPRLRFLSDGRYARQAGDLSVHIGTDNHLVNAPDLVR